MAYFDKDAMLKAGFTKTTKANFGRKLEKYPSLLTNVIGRIPTPEEISYVSTNGRDNWNNLSQHARTAKYISGSNKVKFSDGSVVELANNSYTQYTVYTLDAVPVYVVEQVQKGGAFGIVTKYMIYYIKEK